MKFYGLLKVNHDKAIHERLDFRRCCEFVGIKGCAVIWKCPKSNSLNGLKDGNEMVISRNMWREEETRIMQRRGMEDGL